MEQDVAREILTEVRQLGTRLDAKIDGVRDELKIEMRGVESRLDAKLELARVDWRGYFDELSASTQHCYSQLSARVDALRVEVVRNTRKRR
jgi:hypothetical protein